MFKRGDIVRLKTGQQPIIVTLGHGRGELTGYYLSSSMTKGPARCERDFVLYDEPLKDFHYSNWKTLKSWYEEYYIGTFPTINRRHAMPKTIMIGDTVVLNGGTKPLEVLRNHGGYINARYIGSRQNIRRRTNKFKITHSVHDPVSQAVIGQDYVTPDGQRASLVGTRRDGSFVLETYDTSRGRSCLIIQTKLGRRHYNLTVRLKNVTDGYTFHRRIKEGQVKLNDLIKSPTGKLYTVIEMDTENSNNIFLEGSVMVEKEIK